MCHFIAIQLWAKALYDAFQCYYYGVGKTLRASLLYHGGLYTPACSSLCEQLCAVDYTCIHFAHSIDSLLIFMAFVLHIWYNLLIVCLQKCNINPCANGGSCWTSEESFYCACRAGMFTFSALFHYIASRTAKQNENIFINYPQHFHGIFAFSFSSF